jgi:hypothetical protein
MGAFDGNGSGEETGVFDEGEVGVFNKGRGKEFGVLDGKGELSVSNDGGGEGAAVFDEGEAEDIDNEMGIFGKSGVPDEDGDEIGASGCDDDTPVDAGGTIHRPRRSKPRGHAALGEEVEGDESWSD